MRVSIQVCARIHFLLEINMKVADTSTLLYDQIVNIAKGKSANMYLYTCMNLFINYQINYYTLQIHLILLLHGFDLTRFENKITFNFLDDFIAFSTIQNLLLYILFVTSNFCDICTYVCTHIVCMFILQIKRNPLFITLMFKYGKLAWRGK